ncbi:ATP-binding cassette domain-containing protein [Streptomyces sp. HUCO-GS316]|uniref:ABC transporter ATP-binding protein n=1 Tax=Streptomyces sp. HUCO-GS316 TaxID=2692198 RepID=UPI00136D4DB2|nr:ABC transporter ATP-binding protein [Streptomyces sp. HUCO-GS316]MXM64552.1 ATP-binding cassette domain-containing protein [Streptomyces sp. HUCO-GS316]
MSTDDQVPILEADEVVAGYLPGVDVLRGCSVRVEPGELVGVIGPNGAGKSTLIKAVFGLLRIRAGSVRLLGEDVTNRPAHEQVRRGVGYVPQLQNVFPALTVEENLRMGIYLRPGAFARRAAELEELFPVLAARRKQKAGSMSGGERQMLAMARALMMEPRLLLLDEPSAGLSPAHQDLVFEQVKGINGAGVAVLMVEQNARRCLQICHRGYVLDQGRNAYTGTGTRLLHDEKVIELYLGTLARVR